ncbi:MAG: LytR family transcriptional regulator [Clostridia bacterium]|nr:LytR family transcriptional regulator [Clostridia bacterium]
MGVDKKNQEMVDEIPANGGQSDCMILLVMDTETKVTQMIQISRESMVDVAIYDENGTYMRSQNAQICLQYAFGDGKKRSCWLAENLVSALFYNMPIDAYAALNVEGISAITTAMGGVDLTIPQDYSSIDPSFVQGTQVNLQGDLAVKYVQYRDITEAGSNNGRMERQNHFLRAMASQVKAKYGSGNAYESLLDVADPYMVTDLSVDQIEQLGSYSLADEILKVPGETVTGEEHDEYHIDMDGLYELVLDVFYDPVADETEPA